MDLCRFCCEQSPSMKQIFNKKDDPNVFNILQIFKNIEVTESDNLSKLICSGCYEFVTAVYKFYNNFIKCQNILKLLQSRDDQNRIPQHRQVLPNSDNPVWKCKNCKNMNEFSSAQDYMHHIEEIHLTDLKFRPYLCCNCTEKYRTKQELENHLRTIHLSKNTCYFCNTWFLNSSQVHNHIEKEHDNYQFLCKICNRILNTRTEFNKHYKTEHSKDNVKLYCSQCGKSNQGFSDYYNLARHITEVHSQLNDHNQTQQKDLSCVDRNAANTLDDSEIFMDEEFLENEFLDEIFFQDNDSFQFTESWLNLDFIDNEINDYDSNNRNLSVNNDELTIEEQKESKEILPTNKYSKNLVPKAKGNILKEYYKCPHCSQNEFSKLSDLKLHVAHDHHEYVLACNYCGYKFNRMEDLNSHVSQHIPENMIIYSNTKAQGEIIQNQGENSRIFECKQCSRRFHRERNFLIHICESKTSSPNAAKPALLCALCGKSFKNHKEGYKHKKEVHNIEPIECIICDKQFKTKAGLEYHLKAHTGIRAFNCPYCSRNFTANMNLNSHIRTVHCEIKVYECKLCDRKFSTLDHLKKHVSVHQKERNHRCNTCGKGFAQKSHLTQHELIHTGRKRFYCELCLKGFIKRVDKTRHVQKCGRNMNKDN